MDIGFTEFENMEVRQDSILLTTLIYSITKHGEFTKDFGLKDQIRRAVNSVSSNVVEGFERQNNNEFIRFLKIAKGSCGEVRNQIHITFRIGYIDQSDFEILKTKCLSLSKQITGFIKYLEKNRKGGNFTIKQPNLLIF